MSDVAYRFWHTGRQEKMPVPAGSSVSIADLDSHIKNVDLASLGPRRLAEAALLFYEPDSGKEYAEDGAQIPVGATVVVRLLTMWSAAFQGSKRAAEFRRLAAEAESRRAAKKEAAAPAPKQQQQKQKRSFWHFLKTPQGYVCHRCGVPGHYIQACPTNGDPGHDLVDKRRRVGGGGSMSSSSKEEEAGGFGDERVSCCSSQYSGKLAQGPVGNAISCTRGISSPAKPLRFPADLVCPLCKGVMREAVLARCCFRSFCGGCIRARMVATSTCGCGAAAEGVVPNKTLRETIARTLAAWKSSSGSSSTVTEEGETRAGAGVLMDVKRLKSSRC